MTKIRVTIDVDKADDMLSKWSHDNDSYRNGIFGCDEDGIYHMYYLSRNDMVSVTNVIVNNSHGLNSVIRMVMT